MTRNWLTDFHIRPGAVVVKKTGAVVPIDGEHISETLAWFVYFFSLGRLGAPPRPGFTVCALPDRLRPWYLFWPVARAAGGRFVTNPGAADMLIAFDDSAIGAPAPPAHNTARLRLNFECDDISKSRVAQAQARAFGYALAVDPETHAGPMVEKGEANGVHDGRIVVGPCAPQPGKVYQRIIQNRGARGLMEDLRTPTVGGRPVCVFIKRRTEEDRFTNHNREVELADVDAVFSPDEQAAIARFCADLRMDWGGLDVLRDAGDGKLYIVDANKTDMGPPTALPLADKLTATRLLAKALRTFMERRAPDGLREDEDS